MAGAAAQTLELLQGEVRRLPKPAKRLATGSQKLPKAFLVLQLCRTTHAKQMPHKPEWFCISGVVLSLLKTCSQNAKAAALSCWPAGRGPRQAQDPSLEASAQCLEAVGSCSQGRLTRFVEGKAFITRVRSSRLQGQSGRHNGSSAERRL